MEPLPRDRPAVSEAAPPTHRARTALLEQLRDLHRQEQQGQGEGGHLAPAKRGPQAEEANSNESDSEDDSNDAAPMAVRFVRACPPLTDPTWAMEELLRIDPHVALWTGTGLSKAVWAPPGSGHCPFGTTEADFVRHR
ncbi:uncharacterized protein Tco025E_03463 [Trypanosoma conorhini]|uniref:Uncharacterized protein n=1 Tax=Trypanosoma conorhini TaxID=83891 RepID=A0A422PV88_9TRYP|nr:uncharacterized protein Tco025E_03463 [Trypanosoma conorhini]RNF21622.1 hypothetical protein Tco025E_03463 [Trypanosoma conorhini]